MSLPHGCNGSTEEIFSGLSSRQHNPETQMSAATARKSATLPPRATSILTGLKLGDESVLARLKQTRAAQRRDMAELSPLKATFAHNNKGLPDDHPTLIEQAARIAELETRIAMRESDIGRAKARKTGGMVEAELRKIIPGAEGFADADVTVKAGTTLAALDSKIDAVTAKRRKLRNAGRPVAERRAAMERQIRAMALRGRPDVSNLAYGGPVKFTQTRVGRTGNTLEYATDAAALVAWLYEDDLLLKLDALVSAEADEGSISVAAQLRALDELADELLTLHRQRAAIVNKLAAEGQEIHHRPDAPVEAVLMVEIL